MYIYTCIYCNICYIDLAEQRTFFRQFIVSYQCHYQPENGLRQQTALKQLQIQYHVTHVI